MGMIERGIVDEEIAKQFNKSRPAIVRIRKSMGVKRAMGRRKR